MADSRDVATYFDKNHRDVLRNIRELHCTPVFRERNFAPFKINDLSGETTSHVAMTKNGFIFLAMGFTGAKAALFKERYIEAFDVMEAELRHRATAPAAAFAIPGNLADALQFAANQARELQRQQDVITTMAPKAEFVDRFVNSDGFYGYHDAARALGCRPQYFCNWLRGRYCHAKGALTPFAKFLDEGIFVTRNFTAANGHTGPQFFVTPKGIEFFSTRVPADIRSPATNAKPAPASLPSPTAH
jgi:Rha family phage regulatory protein